MGAEGLGEKVWGGGGEKSGLGVLDVTSGTLDWPKDWALSRQGKQLGANDSSGLLGCRGRS